MLDRRDSFLFNLAIVHSSVFGKLARWPPFGGPLGLVDLIWACEIVFGHKRWDGAFFFLFPFFALAVLFIPPAVLAFSGHEHLSIHPSLHPPSLHPSSLHTSPSCVYSSNPIGISIIAFFSPFSRPRHLLALPLSPSLLFSSHDRVALFHLFVC